MAEVLITGASGRIGRVISDGLAKRGHVLRLFDRVPGGPEVIVGDLSDLPLLEAVSKGVDCVIHLAGIPEEAAFTSLLEDNIVGTYNVFEAARRAGVPRIVFASTNHVIGFHPSSETVDELSQTRPDTLYAVSKVFGEALARLFYDKHGIDAAVLRIGSFRPVPGSRRELATWLSHGDAVRLFSACVESPELGFVVAYGVSANTRLRWRDKAGPLLGYQPKDDAEIFADRIEASSGEDLFHGGEYTAPGHMGGFETTLTTDM
jgi:uronate dehydrogenase